MINSLHHLQLAMPKGSEEKALGFYRDVMGLDVVEKPDALSARGGVWFERGEVRLHLGVEQPFTPAKKAHPAFQVASLADAISTLEKAGCPLSRDVDLPGLHRVFTEDPFGNRIELVERLGQGTRAAFTPSP